MNPTAVAVMLAIATGAISLFLFALVQGYPLLLASMVAVFIAMFVRWG